MINTIAMRPIKSVMIPGYISRRPPSIMDIRSSIFISLNTYPLMPADTPKIPTSDVMIISITSKALVSIKSMAGFRPKTYGTMKAAIARRVALIAVFIGEAPAMAEPA